MSPDRHTWKRLCGETVPDWERPRTLAERFAESFDRTPHAPEDLPEIPDISRIEGVELSFDTTQHSEQVHKLWMLMQTLLRFQGKEPSEVFYCSKLSHYFSRSELFDRKYHGADFFVVRNAPDKPGRCGWVAWEEGGRYPDLIFEILTDDTIDEKLGRQKDLYQDIFRVPEYFCYGPVEFQHERERQLLGFQLVRGKYQPIEPNDRGLLWSEILETFIGEIERPLRFTDEPGQLRFFDLDGNMIPTWDDKEEWTPDSVGQARFIVGDFSF